MSDEIRFRSDMGVELVSSMASDHMVVDAARISTSAWHGTSAAHDLITDAGLINYLMKNRHGTPFEHNAFTFRIECPIFVAREFMRHRIASYNEESGRYKQLDPVFWIPAPARPLVQEGKPGHYVMKPGTVVQYDHAVGAIKRTCLDAYSMYKLMLEDGVCREVARACLPVSIYTSFYVTMNARSLMNFLSLRVDDPDATYQSKPQYEIQQAAEQMENAFYQKMPVTHRTFVENGRVAP